MSKKCIGLLVLLVLAFSGCRANPGPLVNRVAEAEGNLLNAWPVEGEAHAITVAPDGTLFVTINNSHRVVQHTFAGKVVGGWDVAGEVAAIAVSPEGQVAVVNSELGQVQIYAP